MKINLFIVFATLLLILGNATLINANSRHHILAQKQQNIVNFPDKVLENAIRKKLKLNKKTPLTVDKLAKITSLEIDNHEPNTDGQKIKSLEGIEKLKNLTSLTLIFHNITDIKPLASLSKLTELDLTYNQIIDIKPLAGLSKLTSLNLGSNLKG